MAKDLFSESSKQYAAFRPVYPIELFNYILSFVNERHMAWDCATGNGQAARELAGYFDQVEATDLSAEQISLAVSKPNIHYQVCPAESTPFTDNSFDLITVATAYHWLNWEKFRQEAVRVGKPGSVIAIWAYNLVCTDDPALHQLIRHFYWDIIHPYWDPERKFVEDSYSTVVFNYTPLPSKDFELRLGWTKDHLKGYIQSWSGYRNYLKQNTKDPLLLIQKDLDAIWPDGQSREFSFPLFLKLGKIEKMC